MRLLLDLRVGLTSKEPNVDLRQVHPRGLHWRRIPGHPSLLVQAGLCLHCAGWASCIHPAKVFIFSRPLWYFCSTETLFLFIGGVWGLKGGRVLQPLCIASELNLMQGASSRELKNFACFDHAPKMSFKEVFVPAVY